MGRSALVGLFGAALALIGCRDGGPSEIRVTLTLLAAPACRPPSSVELLRVDALGDFPPSDARTVEILPISADAAFDRFPAETQVLRFGPQGWDAAGFLARDAFGLSSEVLILPFGERCPLDDAASIWVVPASAIAMTEGGTIVVAGGREAGVTTDAVRILGPNARNGEEITAGLDRAREGATATAVGDLVVVAGGGDTTGAAFGSFEVVDVAGRAIVSRGPLVRPRRDHGASRLLDGRVLLVGGLDAVSGNVLASAEVIDPETGESVEVGPLPWARRAPEVLMLDDGAVVVLGGYGTGGLPTINVAIFDPIGEVFVEQDDSIAFVPTFARFDAVPLPGARVAFFGDYDGPPPAPPQSYPRVRPLRRVPPFDVPGVLVNVSNAELGFDLAELTLLEDLRDKRAAALPDGTIFMTGLVGGTEPRAYFVDLAHASLVAAPAVSVPLAVFARPDGTIVELDETRATLRREDVATEFDNPPATLFVDELAFDAAGRWETTGLPADTFRSLAPNARVDLAAHRFANVRIESLEVEGGAADVLLVSDERPPVEIAIRPTEAGPSLCTLPRTELDPVSIERRGDRVTIEVAGVAIECTVEGLTERVGIGIVASPGATIRRLQVQRLGE